MTSFVTEVLASSGKLEKEDLSEKISRMSHKVEDTKEKVCDIIIKKYDDFLPSLHGSRELMGEVDEVSKEMDVLKTCFESEIQQNIHRTEAEYAKLMEQLQKNTVIIAMLEHLKEYSNALEEFHKALMEKQYVIAANQLQRARTIVDALKGWKSSQLALLSVVTSELTVQRENLLFHLGDEWKGLVIWKLPPSKEPAGLQCFLKVELNLFSHKDGGQKPPSHLCCVLQALAIQGDLQHKIKLFSQALMKYILKPLVLYPSLSVLVTELQGERTIITLQHLEESQEERSTPSQVYGKVLMVLKVLHALMLDMSIGDKSLSAILGELIWEDMSQYIIHECLLYSIPTNSHQLGKYDTVIKETKEFETSLREMDYLWGTHTDLFRYVKDVNCHFASKKCKDVIETARKLMTSKMHNTVKVVPDTKLHLPILPGLCSEGRKKHDSSKEDTTVMMSNEKQLSVWTLRLPACRISESVQELMELAHNTLSEAVESSTECAFQLFFAVRNIFQLFLDVVPTYHKENLLKFPHLAAIQHNNCMYLAHHLLTLGHYFRGHLPQPLSESVATFVDMVPAFKKLGAQCFLAQLNVQRRELLERLSIAHNFSNLDNEDNYVAASKAVRQVIHQLKQLGIVWQDVLPVNICCKAMGSLLNTAIMEIVSKIMMLEDISSADAEHLHMLCQIVIEEGPLVFIPLAEESKNKKYQEEVQIYVKKWNTFKELVIILRANLQEIVDRWADGKGPLALEFSISEMKSLVRALFQNTERRAVALTKIK